MIKKYTDKKQDLYINLKAKKLTAAFLCVILININVL